MEERVWGWEADWPRPLTHPKASCRPPRALIHIGGFSYYLISLVLGYPHNSTLFPISLFDKGQQFHSIIKGTRSKAVLACAKEATAARAHGFRDHPFGTVPIDWHFTPAISPWKLRAMHSPGSTHQSTKYSYSMYQSHKVGHLLYRSRDMYSIRNMKILGMMMKIAHI